MSLPSLSPFFTCFSSRLNSGFIDSRGPAITSNHSPLPTVKLSSSVKSTAIALLDWQESRQIKIMEHIPQSVGQRDMDAFIGIDVEPAMWNETRVIRCLTS